MTHDPPSNHLSEFMSANGIKNHEAMNVLQQAGIISDLAMDPRQVAKADEWRAIQYLREVFRK